MTKEDLIAFEEDIAKCFEAGQIRAPVHLHVGAEDGLLEVFRDVKPEDWVFSTHRSHYHALLKGVPPALVKAEILKGNSISLQFPEYRFHTSAIVGGILPIALGVAMTGQKVWCFCGEMAAETGIFHECIKYAHGHKLPITFVVENNSMSVETPTWKVWPSTLLLALSNLKRFSYQRRFPHQGSGVYVVF